MINQEKKVKYPFNFEESWAQVLKGELEKPYICELARFVEQERSLGVPVYPPSEQMFTALWKTPFPSVKVVIMGQDPYHGPGQAHGLSFSVNKGVAIPPSLRNIYKEMSDDFGFEIPNHGCLIPWAEQGVLLLNATLTVVEKSPMAHHGKGWELFTDAIVRALSLREDPVIFVLWGSNAQKKCGQILNAEGGNKKHPILTAPHPSPLSCYRGFFGCQHFSKINALLEQMDKEPIDWSL